jgi:1-acyl-sn-glycerol-3-phosphate acyltransferase
MLVLRSLAFNVAFFGWTLVMVIAALPALGLPRRFMLGLVRVWVRGILGLMRRLVGQHVEVRGRDLVPEGACIVASKHQSVLETLIVNIVLKAPAIVVKRELYAIPGFGWELRAAGMIAIDRRGGVGALRGMVRDARAAVADGRPVVMFPEGTRTAPGSSAPFHTGISALYGALGLPVVPAAVNSGVLWARRDFVKRPGRIVMEFLPPIEPGLARRAFAARLETAIETAAARLIAETRDLTLET